MIQQKIERIEFILSYIKFKIKKKEIIRYKFIILSLKNNTGSRLSPSLSPFILSLFGEKRNV